MRWGCGALGVALLWAAWGCRGPRTPARDAAVAPRAVAVDVPATDVPAPRPAPRVVYGRMRPTEEGERCETADGTVVHFDPTQPLFTLDAASRGQRLRASARSHGRAMLVLSWATDDDPTAVECAEAATEGAWVTLPLAPGDAPLRVYASTRTGETAPFVAAVHTADAPPDAAPHPLETPAPGVVWARWQLPAEGCDGEACAQTRLHLMGATTRDLVLDAEILPHRCVGARDAVALGCTGGGFDALQVAAQGGGYAVTRAHTSDGNCGAPCPTTRTRLARFVLPAGQRLVPHPAGVFTW